MRFSHSIGGGLVTMTFDGKPSERVRQIMKASGFRWSPTSQHWWRGRVAGAADTIAAVDQQLRREAGTPDGACWHCQSPQGFFRRHSAATPVYCDACEAKAAAADRPHAPDVDLLYEDSCREACGL